MQVHCFAKVNLFLNIRERRTDGYHNLESVFQNVSLFDTILISESDEFSLRVSGAGVNLQSDPGLTEDNILAKVWRAFRDEFAVPPLRLRLTKRIPLGAGLGGGSS